MIVAVDGTSGSGKSTICKQVSKQIDFAYIQTGAFYRAITHHVLENKIDPQDQEKIAKLLKNIKIDSNFAGEHTKICVNGKNITSELYTPNVSLSTSIVAAIKPVREYVQKLQKATAKQYKNIIMEGRDIGSVIFPNADLKVFIDCSIDERAKRRFEQYTASGQDANLDKIKQDLIERDYNDTHRAISPLVRLPEAYYLDTTSYSINECVQMLIDRIKNAK